MILSELKIENFRNYALEHFEPDPELNLICGLNAQGKSNLLESICYLGLASSFRGAGDNDLIRWEQPYFYVEAEAESKSYGKLHISAAASRKRQKRWTLNHQPLKRLSEAVGLLHCVVFAPEDVLLIKSGPDLRRRYLNRQMSQLDREYCRLLMRYNHILRQRNACLKQGDQVDMEQLSAWDAQLAAAASGITRRRAQVVQQLSPLAADLHVELTGREHLDLFYESGVLARMGHPAIPPSSDVEGSERLERELNIFYLTEITRMHRAELQRGVSMVGPHRDDMIVRINRRPARDFASQGQQRSAALTLKLAELELAKQQSGEYPLLLLDDVFSELDRRRRNQIINLVRGKAQTFITVAEDKLPLPSGQRWLIEQGRIVR